LLLTTSCNNRFILAPKPPNNGTAIYRTGWKDGCHTGMSAYSSIMHRQQYGIRFIPENMKNIEYKRGWELGHSYCSYYMKEYLSNKNVNSFLGNNNWGYDFRSDNVWGILK